MNRDDRNAPALTTAQRRILLWLPIVGFWCVLFLVSKTAEGGRDWPSFLMMGIAGTGALMFVWFGLWKLTAKKRPSHEAPDEGDAPASRAQLIYGRSPAEQGEDSEKEEESS